MNHSMICLLFIASFINALGAKSPYRITLERVTVVEVNEKYFKANIWTVRLSRYDIALSGYVTAFDDLSRDMVVNIKCYEFRNNEYRPSIININRDLCHWLKFEYTFFYPAFRKTGSHVPEPKCPIAKGNYTFNNFSVSNAELPMGLPFKKVKVQTTFLLHDAKLLDIETYGYFDEDVLIRERYS